MSKNAIIALAVTGGVVITGYFVYRYYQTQQANTQKNTQDKLNPGSADNIGNLITAVGNAGGISGLIGSIF